MIKCVLDASALLALLNGEEGGEKVGELLPYASMSSVNLSECVAVLNLTGISEKEVESMLSCLISHVETFDEAQAYMTGNLRSLTKTQGLSFGDRACLALGKLKNLPVVTADRAWKSMNHFLRIEFIR